MPSHKKQLADPVAYTWAKSWQKRFRLLEMDPSKYSFSRFIIVVHQLLYMPSFANNSVIYGQDARTTDTQWRHNSKKSEILGRCGRQNMLRPYLKIWDWDLIFGHAVKAISSLGVRSPWPRCITCNLILQEPQWNF